MSTPLPPIAADVEARLKALESEVAAEKTKLTTHVKNLIKANWAHVPTWAGVGYVIFKHLL
jgi:hypothetical protein